MPTEKNIKTPERLWELFTEFVEHETQTPWEVQDFVGHTGKEVTKRFQVPIVWEAFECYLADKGVINDLGDYAANTDDRYSEYTTIVTRIRNFIFANNFKGAAVGQFQQNIIARKLGLIDKKGDDTKKGEINHTITGMKIE